MSEILNTNVNSTSCVIVDSLKFQKSKFLTYIGSCCIRLTKVFRILLGGEMVFWCIKGKHEEVRWVAIHGTLVVR